MNKQTMNLDEYTKKLKRLNYIHKTKVNILETTYAESHRLFNIGDTITDGIIYLRVKKFDYVVDLLTHEPTTRYHGESNVLWQNQGVTRA